MKLLSWFSKILISTVLISTLTVLTTWYVVSLYVDEIIRQYQLPGIGKKIQISDITARLSEELNISKPRDGAVAINDKVVQPSPSASTKPPAGTQSNGTIPGASSASSSGASSLTAPTASPATSPYDLGSSGASGSPAPGGAKDDAVAVWGQVRQDSEKQQMAISTEEFAEKKDMLTAEDKMKIFSLVVTKLPEDKVQQLSTLLEDGVTMDELEKADEILQQNLEEEEYKQLMEILNKY
ncbi:hypothetical protein [Paenibacillus eucommiae]|uniref:Uncharacterized protein n=1 Tax=Paenibacillus eucommiae TaxID=1355755 RepID=A0ABS4J678_9BACL|nr:hypothetical protein [Paenibacillus eucommiae]MBP1994631.1 hypothetical protein [Paenibacillus eucommiae]